MAKVTKSLTSSNLKFSATFPDGRKVIGKWSGNGETFTVEPYDGATVRRVSGLFALAQERGYKKNLYNPTQFLEVVVATAEASTSVEDFEERLKGDLEKAFGMNMHAPMERETYPETKVTVTKKSRGAQLVARFTNGDDFLLVINGRSVSYSMDPPISGLKAKISELAFATVAIRDAEGAAQLFADAAEGADSVEAWIDNIRSALDPSLAQGSSR